MRTTKRLLVVVMGFAVVGALVGSSMPTTEDAQDGPAFASNGCDLAGAPLNCSDATAQATADDVTGMLGGWLRRLSGWPQADDRDPRTDAAWTDVRRGIALTPDQEVERAKLVDAARQRLRGLR
jgi:hypothetical protein